MFAARGGFLAQPTSAGGFGNDLYFPNNASQLVSTPGATDLVTWKATTGFTIEYWCYFTAWGISINGGPGNQDGTGTNYWSFGPVTGGQLEFYYWGSGQQYFSTATGAMNLNTWYHIAAVFTTVGTSTTAMLYINGSIQQIQWNKTGSYASSQTVTNGVVSAGTVFGMGKYGSSLLSAYIDNLRVSNINRYSGASFSVPTGSFTSDANTQILLIPSGTVGSTTITDSSGFARTMTNASNLVTISATHANHT